MANEDHVKILNKGSNIWNEWRKNQGEVFPKFSEIDLSGINLKNANLSDADFAGTELVRADLSGADLRDADFNGADLSGANLSGADLRWATLFGTNFSYANLKGANIGNARLAFTLILNVDISEVNDIEEAIHDGPSSIGIDTIYLSKGKIPYKFLREAGVQQKFIDYMNSLTTTAFDYYSCFISYSSKNEDFAKRLYVDLQSEGVRCWFAPENLKIGQKIRTEIDEAIKIHDKLLLILSESSVKSDWVEKEVETAFEKERKENKAVLFPVRLDESVFETDAAWAADIRRTRHIGDFINWQNNTDYKNAFNRLIQDLKVEDMKVI